MRAPKTAHDALAGVATGISLVPWLICCSGSCTSKVILHAQRERSILQVQLTTRVRDLLEKLAVVQLVKAIPTFMEAESTIQGNRIFMTNASSQALYRVSHEERSIFWRS
jgi:hypothetical protein